MRCFPRFAALLLACVFAVSSAAFAADPSPEPSAASTPVPKERTVSTQHVAHIDGRDIHYTATAGTIELRNAKDEATASVFYVAYVADGLGPTEKRPITFAYNGGPGGSSALIHMGAFGPRMVVTTNGALTAPPPYEIVDNNDSLLASSDLVFVDAVGTGFSRIIGKGTPKDFYGVDEDGRAFAQFIRRYITRNDRWNSPKFLAGESYGTTRSAVLAKMLQDQGISVSGVTLMSSVLYFSTIFGGNADDMPYWLYVPTEAAVAAYHHKVAATGDLTAFLARARAFAQGPYANALAKGADLSNGERHTIATELHAFIGLPVAYLEKSDLRVPPDRFQKELLGSEDRTVGRYDGRFSAFDLDPVSADAESDPSSDAVFGAFTAAFNAYIRTELHYTTDDEYVFLSYTVNQQWNFKRGGDTSMDVTGDLASAMTANAYLRVFSANGIYDMATPFFATEYTLKHLGINRALQPHITYGYYPSGHMVYLNPVAHASLARDLRAFYADATKR